jgi:hypothetical protein
VPIRVTCPTCKGVFNAPDSAAGKRAKCPTCGGVIDIQAPPPPPEEVLDAEVETASRFDDDDFDVEPPADLPAAIGDRKPCPMCGEMIQKDAVKCRYCGEIFDPVLRASEQKKARASDPDSTMTALDWVLAIICSNIACILGIIWMVQGKPKGKIMILAAILANVGWAIIGAILGALQEM